MSRAAIAGDIAGSRFEWSMWDGATVASAACAGFEADAPATAALGERAASFDLFHADTHPTDDSVLMLAVMDWLLEGGDPRAHLRRRFRSAPKPELFGRFFRAWAEADGDIPCGSVGNGAAMRMAPVAYAAPTADEALALARENALATHATAEGIAGAQAMALGVFRALAGEAPDTIGREISARFGYDLERPLDSWRPGYRFTSACPLTVPIAFRAFMESSSHEQAVRAAVSIGGDTDTIACMAGALAGARWGFSADAGAQVAAKLGPVLMPTVDAFEKRHPKSLPTGNG